MPESILDESFELRPGQEWHSSGMRLEEGQQVIVRAKGSGRFYTGFFSREAYFRKRDAPNPFPFTFGTDRSQYTTKVSIGETDYYYIVVRVGIFAQRTKIQLEVTVE